MTTSTQVTVVVPTIGSSPVFERCLEALASSSRAVARVVVVADSATASTAIPRHLVDRLILAPANSGFAVSCNLGLAEIDTPLAAIVNDDAVVEPEWLDILVEELERDPLAGAVQGVNLQMSDPGKIDGCGIAWDRRWQPVQIDHGSHQPSVARVSEVFGASATAVVYRTDSLIQSAVAARQVFDPKLHTYYDDVDLAGRLRAARYRSLVVPSAQAYHAGGASTSDALEWRHGQIYGNRLLVLARLLGRSFWARLPVILWPDVTDLLRAMARRDRVQYHGILKGWRRTADLLRSFAHSGPPLVSLREMHDFQRKPWTDPRDT